MARFPGCYRSGSNHAESALGGPTTKATRAFLRLKRYERIWFRRGPREIARRIWSRKPLSCFREAGNLAARPRRRTREPRPRAAARSLLLLKKKRTTEAQRTQRKHEEEPRIEHG